MPEQNEPKPAEPEAKPAEKDSAELTELKAKLAAAEKELSNLRAHTPGEHLAAARVEPVATPPHAYYKVLVDTWGYDTPTHKAPVKGELIPASRIGPHWEWALQTGVIKGVTAKEARGAEAELGEVDPDTVIQPDDDVETVEAKTQATMVNNVPSPHDDPATVTAKQLARASADVARTRAAEERQNRANLAAG